VNLRLKNMVFNVIPSDVSEKQFFILIFHYTFWTSNNVFIKPFNKRQNASKSGHPIKRYFSVFFRPENKKCIN
jgi:hypothetical protein